MASSAVGLVVSTTAMGFQSFFQFLGDTVRGIVRSVFGSDIFYDMLQFLYQFLLGAGTVSSLLNGFGMVKDFFYRKELTPVFENFERTGNTKKDFKRLLHQLYAAVDEDEEEDFHF